MLEKIETGCPWHIEDRISARRVGVTLYYDGAAGRMPAVLQVLSCTILSISAGVNSRVPMRNFGVPEFGFFGSVIQVIEPVSGLAWWRSETETGRLRMIPQRDSKARFFSSSSSRQRW